MVDLPMKSEVVATRVTPPRKALYQETAAREGMRLSEWLRALAELRVRESAEGPEITVGRA